MAAAFDMTSGLRTVDVEVSQNTADSKAPHDGNGTYYEDYDGVSKSDEDNCSTFALGNSCFSKLEISVVPPQPRIILAVDTHSPD